MKRHLVLIGLPGAGKTTVGQIAATKLGAVFVDLDALLVRHMQMPVARIFAEFGEARFREEEQRAMDRVLEAEPSVIASGGGWAAQPGELERVQAAAFIIYLRCRPETAARRAAGEVRPLLAHDDPFARMRELLRDREPYYSRANAVVSVDRGAPADAAAEVVAAARRGAGW